MASWSIALALETRFRASLGCRPLSGQSRRALRCRRRPEQRESSEGFDAKPRQWRRALKARLPSHGALEKANEVPHKRNKGHFVSFPRRSCAESATSAVFVRSYDLFGSPGMLRMTGATESRQLGALQLRQKLALGLLHERLTSNYRYGTSIRSIGRSTCRRARRRMLTSASSAR